MMASIGAEFLEVFGTRGAPQEFVCAIPLPQVRGGIAYVQHCGMSFLCTITRLERFFTVQAVTLSYGGLNLPSSLGPGSFDL